MALIEFKNLPDTTTPVNAGNLNNNFDFLNDKIDGIVESGSNANGNYVKFDDGTMICWRYIYPTLNYISASSAGTTMCRASYTAETSGPLPATFTTNPSVLVTANALAFKNYNSSPKTQWGSVTLFLPYTAAQSDFQTHMNFIAIGKWK